MAHSLAPVFQAADESRVRCHCPAQPSPAQPSPAQLLRSDWHTIITFQKLIFLLLCKLFPFFLFLGLSEQSCNCPWHVSRPRARDRVSCAPDNPDWQQPGPGLPRSHDTTSDAGIGQSDNWLTIICLANTLYRFILVFQRSNAERSHLIHCLYQSNYPKWARHQGGAGAGAGRGPAEIFQSVATWVESAANLAGDHVKLQNIIFTFIIRGGTHGAIW